MIAVSFDTAIYQWRAGERRLAEAAPPESVALERVTSRIHAELRRRLGGPFTVDELVALYDRGTGWCLDLAYAVAPGAPWAWRCARWPTPPSPATCAKRPISPGDGGWSPAARLIASSVT